MIKKIFDERNKLEESNKIMKTELISLEEMLNRANDEKERVNDLAQMQSKEIKELNQRIERLQQMTNTIGEASTAMNTALGSIDSIITNTSDEWGKKFDVLEMLGVSLKPEEYIFRGNHFFYRSEHENALKAYDRAIELDPNDAKAWCNKGAVLANLNRHGEVLKAYDRCIELDPQYARGWYNRAIFYSLQGKRENALLDLSRAIELNTSFRIKAKTNEAFKNFWNDEVFKKLV